MIIYSLKKNNNQENCIPINKKLYTILVLPKKYSNLIQYLNEKYKKFIDKNSIIYKIETCEKCKLIRNDSSNTEEENKKKLLLHKKKHSDISENDIIKINKKYKKIFV